MLSFRQIKIRHIFILQFGGYFVKFHSRQIFRPYGTSVVSLNMCVRIYVHVILYYCASVVLIRILP